MLKQELFTRYPENPILSPEGFPFPINAVYNAGAVKFQGKYILVLRVEGKDKKSRLHIATSQDGYNFKVEPEPIKVPLDEWEVQRYDPRVTNIEYHYYITYCAQQFEHTVRGGLIKTDDFVNFERMPYISEPQNRNCCLFPEKIDGLYTRLDRPMGTNYDKGWISYSPDLIFWGKSKPVNLKPEIWFRKKWGPGPPPIKTREGWLMIFHGIWWGATGDVYRAGLALLNLEDPSKVIAQLPEYILGPETDYERIGDVNNTVFPTGVIVEPDGQVKLYYGAADRCTCVAEASLDNLVSACIGKS